MHKSSASLPGSLPARGSSERMGVASTVGKRDTKLAAGALLLIAAIICLHFLSRWKDPTWQPWATAAAAMACIIFGVTIIRAFVATIAERTVDYLGVTRVQSARSAISGVLYVILALTVASQTEIDLSGIALSGAVTGVIVGIAAQASIANVVAGIVILFARPFRPGQYVTVRAAAFAGNEYSGVVGEITLFYTTLLSGVQEIRVPNSSMVTSVVTLRPQLFEVYLPVIVPAGQWGDLSTTSLTNALEAALPAGRTVIAQVERMEAGNVQLGVRASVATIEERAALEQAVVDELRGRIAVAANPPGCAAEDGASEPELA
jgi:hypothetical protein